MAYRTVYFDDEIDDRVTQGIAEALRVPGELECELRRPPPDVSSAAENLPDALLVDFDLSTRPSHAESGDYVSYFGSTLAAEVRIRHPACPIVLITKKERITGVSALIAERVDVDLVLFKDDIISNPALAQSNIVDLIRGFKELTAVVGQGWEAVLTLMGANPDEARLLREAAPPVVEGQWNVPQVARWMRMVVIRFPGILYDELTAATRLGISREAFRQQHVQTFFREARYRGIFGSVQDRWWRDRLFVTAQAVAIRHDILRGTVSHAFSRAYAAESGHSLEPAICVYDGTPVADWVCYILQAPVKQANSVPYYPDRRPAVMDQARVSFKAIKESNAFDETLVDSDSLAIVRHLWE
jgi:hypothetical protein